MLNADLSIVPRLEALHAYWRSLAGGDVPERSLFDPAAIPSLLPYMYMVDIETSPFRVRYRLSGSEVDRLNGYNLAGRYLDEFTSSGDVNARITSLYRTCCQTGQPGFSSYQWPTASGILSEVRFAIFPLRVNGAIRQCAAIEDWDASVPSGEWAKWA